VLDFKGLAVGVQELVTFRRLGRLLNGALTRIPFVSPLARGANRLGQWGFSTPHASGFSNRWRNHWHTPEDIWRRERSVPPWRRTADRVGLKPDLQHIP
jgi:hypothetical protein